MPVPHAALLAAVGCFGVVGVVAGDGVGVVFAAGAGAAGVAAGAAAALPTVTIGVIFVIVAADTPAFDKSLTAEYGRPAMIFFAVAGPTPFSDSNWDWVAVLRSIGPAGAVLASFLVSASIRPGTARLKAERNSAQRKRAFMNVLDSSRSLQFPWTS